MPIPLQKSGVVVAKISPIEEEFAAVDDDEDAVEAVEEVEGDEKTEEGDTARFRSLGVLLMTYTMNKQHRPKFR